MLNVMKWKIVSILKDMTDIRDGFKQSSILSVDYIIVFCHWSGKPGHTPIIWTLWQNMSLSQVTHVACCCWSGKPGHTPILWTLWQNMSLSWVTHVVCCCWSGKPGHTPILWTRWQNLSLSWVTHVACYCWSGKPVYTMNPITKHELIKCGTCGMITQDLHCDAHSLALPPIC